MGNLRAANALEAPLQPLPRGLLASTFGLQSLVASQHSVPTAGFNVRLTDPAADASRTGRQPVRKRTKHSTLRSMSHSVGVGGVPNTRGHAQKRLFHHGAMCGQAVDPAYNANS